MNCTCHFDELTTPEWIAPPTTTLPPTTTQGEFLPGKGPFLYYVSVKGWVGGIAKYLLFLTGVGG